MWFKLSLLLFLIFCSCNVSSKNLRKSLNQKFDDNGFMEEDPRYLNAASNVNKDRDDVYVREKEYGNGNGVQGKQHRGTLDEIQHNGEDNSNDVQGELRQLQDGGLMNDSPSFDGHKKRQHGRFRRYVYIESGGTTTISSGGFVAWSIWWILVVIVLPILICCCIIGCISSSIYSSMR
uniref:Uncharacterized protein n=1 Tax=Panagrolaimus sp. PS1159 TaxID=55785 RepID=A0AC35GBY0_9BILA